MVRRNRYGLGSPEQALGEFDRLRPHVLRIRALQANCSPLGPDDMGLQIIIDGLETAAYHFTRRSRFFEPTAIPRDPGRTFYPGLGEAADAMAAFEQLRPYRDALLRLKCRCKPFGRDYMALDIADQALATAAYHFTRQDGFYGSRSDSSGPVRAAQPTPAGDQNSPLPDRDKAQS